MKSLKYWIKIRTDLCQPCLGSAIHSVLPCYFILVNNSCTIFIDSGDTLATSPIKVSDTVLWSILFKWPLIMVLMNSLPLSAGDSITDTCDRIPLSQNKCFPAATTCKQRCHEFEENTKTCTANMRIRLSLWRSYNWCIYTDNVTVDDVKMWQLIVMSPRIITQICSSLSFTELRSEFWLFSFFFFFLLLFFFYNFMTNKPQADSN